MQMRRKERKVVKIEADVSSRIERKFFSYRVSTSRCCSPLFARDCIISINFAWFPRAEQRDSCFARGQLPAVGKFSGKQTRKDRRTLKVAARVFVSFGRSFETSFRAQPWLPHLGSEPTIAARFYTVFFARSAWLWPSRPIPRFSFFSFSSFPPLTC